MKKFDVIMESCQKWKEKRTALSGDIDKPTLLKFSLMVGTSGISVLLVPVLKFKAAEVSAETEKCFEK